MQCLSKRRIPYNVTPEYRSMLLRIVASSSHLRCKEILCTECGTSLEDSAETLLLFDKDTIYDDIHGIVIFVLRLHFFDRLSFSPPPSKKYSMLRGFCGRKNLVGKLKIPIFLQGTTQPPSGYIILIIFVVHDGYCHRCDLMFHYDGLEEGILRMSNFLICHRVLRRYMNLYLSGNRLAITSMFIPYSYKFSRGQIFAHFRAEPQFARKLVLNFFTFAHKKNQR